MRSVCPSTSSSSQPGSDLIPFLDARTDIFSYFANALGDCDWSDKDVLDFGGNIGGLLRDPDSTIREERYWCIDIVAQAIEQGKRDYPRAHWLFYDLYNFRFNPYGTRGLAWADPGQRFDIIAAYSVFTSNFEADLLRIVPRLEQMLKPGGRLAFSFMDPDETLGWRLERLREKGADIDVQAMTRRARGAESCVLLNEHELYLNTHEPPCPSPELQTSCYVFHSAAYMQRLFPRATILPPRDEAGQHCCVLQSPS